MSAATNEKYAIPKIKGHSDIATATYKRFRAMTAAGIAPFTQKNISNAKMTHVRIAVSNGAKLAYPKGIKSK